MLNNRTHTLSVAVNRRKDKDMEIRGLFNISTDENGIHITQSMSDDRILLNLLIDKRDSEDDEEIKEKIQDFIRELF